TKMPTRGSNKAARLLSLVAQLEAGPRTAADLARQLGVSQRTLQRDLEELPEIGHAIERDGRRYRLRAGNTTLDPVEALAVHSATRLLVHHTRINFLPSFTRFMVQTVLDSACPPKPL
ncbi:MAG: HTH domain-containing protein, partial [Trueperaceae bacterium]|nr:HTH domain-containing protein [Trueperaceae bacterium]